MNNNNKISVDNSNILTNALNIIFYSHNIKLSIILTLFLMILLSTSTKAQGNLDVIYLKNVSTMQLITKEDVANIQNDSVKIEPSTKNMFSKLYVHANAGYGLSLGQQLLLIKKNDSRTPNIIEGIYGSYVKGLNLGGSIGLTLVDNLIGELAITYNTNNSYEGRWMLQDGPFSKTDGSLLTFSPSIMIQTNLFVKFKPYIRTGVLVGFPSFSLQTNDTKLINDLIDAASNYQQIYPGKSDLVKTIQSIGSKVGNINIESIELTSSGNMALGIIAGTGVLYTLSDQFSISSELFFTSISWTPSESKILIKHSGSFINEPLEINLKHNENSDNPFEITKPIPYGSFGIKLGVIYEF